MQVQRGAGGVGTYVIWGVIIIVPVITVCTTPQQQTVNINNTNEHLCEQ